jgi:hypothetical protein
MALELTYNQIGAAGAIQLSQALLNNMVKQLFFLSSLDLQSYLYTDTHHTRS